MKFDFTWFTSLPGMLITGGVVLLIVALIILLVTNKKSKKMKEAMDEAGGQDVQSPADNGVAVGAAIGQDGMNMGVAPTAMATPDIATVPMATAQNGVAPVETIATVSNVVDPAAVMAATASTNLAPAVPVIAAPETAPTDLGSVANAMAMAQPTVDAGQVMPTQNIEDVPGSVQPVGVSEALVAPSVAPIAPQPDIIQNSVEMNMPASGMDVSNVMPINTDLQDASQANMFSSQPIVNNENVSIYGGVNPTDSINTAVFQDNNTSTVNTISQENVAVTNDVVASAPIGSEFVDGVAPSAVIPVQPETVVVPQVPVVSQSAAGVPDFNSGVAAVQTSVVPSMQNVVPDTMGVCATVMPNVSAAPISAAPSAPAVAPSTATTFGSVPVVPAIQGQAVPSVQAVPPVPSVQAVPPVAAVPQNPGMYQ